MRWILVPGPWRQTHDERERHVEDILRAGRNLKINWIQGGFEGTKTLTLFLPVPVSWGRRGITPQTSCLKQQEFVSSRFWKLEVLDQSVGRVGSF